MTPEEFEFEFLAEQVYRENVDRASRGRPLRQKPTAEFLERARRTLQKAKARAPQPAQEAGWADVDPEAAFGEGGGGDGTRD